MECYEMFMKKCWETIGVSGCIDEAIGMIMEPKTVGGPFYTGGTSYRKSFSQDFSSKIFKILWR